ncbi:MAG: hypothetical protein QM482_04470 [Sulfurospirillum sp.]
MKVTKLLLSAAVIGLFAGVGANAKNMNDQVVPTKHNKHMTLGQIAKIQPGLGTVMIEYSHRFYVGYYAARAGNWGLAGYEIKEMPEIQEVGEITRPGHKAELKAFESTYLAPIQKAIKAKDWNAFTASYAAAEEGCNNCHAGAGFGFIKYRLPTTPPPSLPSVIW